MQTKLPPLLFSLIVPGTLSLQSPTALAPEPAHTPASGGNTAKAFCWIKQQM